jgi:hypothetical protein
MTIKCVRVSNFERNKTPPVFFPINVDTPEISILA